jgi:hypothetical protein
MKKYSRLAMALAVACCLAHSGQAFAGSQTFLDNTLVFPNYTGSNTQDTIITPNINSITVNWDDSGYLTSVVINSSSSYVLWDSLFINSTGGQTWDSWDYLVHGGTGTYGAQEGASAIPGPGLYAVSDGYDYTHASMYRVDHVNGIVDDGTHLTMLEDGFQATIDNYPSAGVYLMTYDFTSLDTKILLGDNFVIGYTPYCANDVILAYGDGLNISAPGGKGPAAVPEPATMILFGFGIASLASWQVRRNKK